MSEERGSDVEVRIRSFRREDAEAVHRWFNNPEATSSLMEVRDSFSLADAEAWVDRAIAHDESDGEDRKWAIEVEGHAEPVGFTALYGLRKQLPPELGAMIGEKVRGRGVGREAERLTVAKAFEEFGAHRVYGRIPAFNKPAQKAVTWQGWEHEGTMREHIRRPDGTLIDCEVWGVTRDDWERRWRKGSYAEPEAEAPEAPPAHRQPRGGLSGVAWLEADAGAAAASDEFFRSRQFLEAEGVTHTLIVELEDRRSAIPLIVRDISGSAGPPNPADRGEPRHHEVHALDASSPYSYPGGEVTGEPIDPSQVDWSQTGLVSVFIRDRLGEPTALAGAADRSIVLVSDPELKRKSRMSDRQQIRKNEAAGYEISRTPGPECDAERRAAFHAVYMETMDHLAASDRYRFEPAYFDLLFDSPRTDLFIVTGPEGDTAAAAITAISDGFLHYYLSGTADAHRKGAPSKNMIVAVTDYAEGLGLPMNLGGGVQPGDSLEEFKRGFANRELPFRTHEVVCDLSLYAQLSAGRADDGFFPLYRAPGPGG